MLNSRSPNRGPREFQGHHTGQACYKSGIMPPEYPSLADPQGSVDEQHTRAQGN
jgi:hypothetical protein